MDEVLIEGLDNFVGTGTKQSIKQVLSNSENDFEEKMDFLIQIKTLSPDAQSIIKLIYNPNMELQKSVQNKQKKRLTKNDLRKFLRKRGWKHVIITNTFKEIEKFFKLSKKSDIIENKLSIPVGVQIKSTSCNGGHLMGKKETKDQKLMKKYAKELGIKIKKGESNEDIIDKILTVIQKKCRNKKYRNDKKNQKMIDWYNDQLEELENNNNNNDDSNNNDNNNDDNNNDDNNNDDNNNDNNNNDDNNNDDNNNDDNNNDDNNNDDNNNDDNNNDDSNNDDNNNDDNNNDDNNNDDNNNDDNNNDDNNNDDSNNDNNDDNNNDDSNNDNNDDEEEENMDYKEMTKAKELKEFIAKNKLGRKCKGYKDMRSGKQLKALIAKALGEETKIEKKDKKKDSKKKTEKKKKSEKKDTKKKKTEKKKDKKKDSKKKTKTEKKDRDEFGAKLGTKVAKLNKALAKGGTLKQITKATGIKTGGIKKRIKALKEKGFKVVSKGKKEEKIFKLKTKK